MHSPQFVAGVAVRAGAAEVRVGDRLVRRLAGSAEEDADRGRVEGVAHPHLVGDLLHHLVGGRVQRVVDHAEHPLGLVVVRRQLGAPVGDVPPLRVVVERRQRLVERVGVDQRAAADPGAGQDEAVLERVDALDAVAARPRAGRGTSWSRTRWRGGPRRRTGRRPRSRRRGSPSRSAAARVTDPPKPEPIDQDVVVGIRPRPSFFISRRLAVITLA